MTKSMSTASRALRALANNNKHHSLPIGWAFAGRGGAFVVYEGGYIEKFSKYALKVAERALHD